MLTLQLGITGEEMCTYWEKKFSLVIQITSKITTFWKVIFSKSLFWVRYNVSGACSYSRCSCVLFNFDFKWAVRVCCEVPCLWYYYCGFQFYNLHVLSQNLKNDIFLQRIPKSERNPDFYRKQQKLFSVNFWIFAKFWYDKEDCDFVTLKFLIFSYTPFCPICNLGKHQKKLNAFFAFTKNRNYMHNKEI